MQERHIGFNGLSADRAFVAGFLGLPAGGDKNEHGQAFEAAFTHAENAMNETLAPASDALAPHIEAVSPEAASLEQRVADAVERGELDPTEVRDTLSEVYALLHEPFQEKVDALRHAQASAMHLFETITAESLHAYASLAAIEHRSG